MKNNLIIFCLILFPFIKGISQTLPIEKAYLYTENDDKGYADDNLKKVKDVNGLLNRYVGTWQAKRRIGFQNYKWTFVITKVIDNSYGIEKDILVLKYIIERKKETFGLFFLNRGRYTPYANILSASDDHFYTVKGHYLSPNKQIYYMFYNGKHFRCGQQGKIYLKETGNLNTLDIVLVGGSENISTNIDCPDGVKRNILPTTLLRFNKI